MVVDGQSKSYQINPKLTYTWSNGLKFSIVSNQHIIFSFVIVFNAQDLETLNKTNTVLLPSEKEVI